MLSPAGPYRAAYDAALRGSAALRASMGGQVRLYVEVPANAPLPYVVIGQDQVVTEDLGCVLQAEATTTINLWSRTAPLDQGAQARAMAAAVIETLGASFPIAGWDVDEVTVESESYVTDPDQSTHGTVILRHLLTQQVA